MKAFLIKLVFLFLFMGTGAAVFGAPFGVLPGPGSVASGEYKKKYLIDKIANGRPVSVCVDGRLDKYSLPKKQIEAALNSWFTHARRAVSTAGRDEEFADLLPVLSEGAEVHVQNCVKNEKFRRIFARETEKGSSAPGYAYASSAEDLRILLLDQSDINDGRSYFNEGHLTSLPYIALNMQDQWGADGLDVLRHELGHALSLSDQYQENRLNSVPEYGTSDILPSMMTSEAFGCDDVDGLIFALDCIAGKNTSRGGEEGWRSFCPQRAGRNYAYCKTKNRGALLWFNKDFIRFARYDRQGNLLEKKDWARSLDPFVSYSKGIPFAASSAKTRTVYEDGYISYKKSRNGECIFSVEIDGKGKPEKTFVCAAATGSDAVVLKQTEENEITSADGYFSVEADKESIQASYAPGGFDVLFVYTPTFRLEYMTSIEGKGEESQIKDMAILLFLKNSSAVYAFMAYDEDSPWIGAATEGTEQSESVRPITREERRKIISLVNDFIAGFDFDTRETLSPLELKTMRRFGSNRYRAFMEGSVQNLMPGSLADGFLFSEEQQAREQLQKNFSSGLRRKL